MNRTAWAAGLLIAACGGGSSAPPGPPTLYDYDQFCADGKPVPGGALGRPPTAKQVTPALAFWKQPDGSWKLRGFFEDQPFDFYQARDGGAVAVVACIELSTLVPTAEHCTYANPKDGAQKSFENAAMEVAFKLRDAKTGAVLEAGTLHAPPPLGCRSLKSKYDEDLTTVGASRIDRLLVASRQSPEALVDGKPVPTNLDNGDLWISCSGRALPMAPALAAGPQATLAYFEQPWGHPWFEPASASGVSTASGTDPLAPLVVCATHDLGEVIASCKGKQVHATTWHYKLVEARTAKTLASKDATASNPDCTKAVDNRDLWISFPTGALDNMLAPFTHG